MHRSLPCTCSPLYNSISSLLLCPYYLSSYKPTKGTLTQAPAMGTKNKLGKRPHSGSLDSPRKYRKIRPNTQRLPRLPHDVVGVIVRHLGVRALGNASQVCRTWRDAVEENGVTLWKRHCERINAEPNFQELVKHTNDLSKLKPKDDVLRKGLRLKLARMYRTAYFTKRNNVCAHCLLGVAKDYTLYSVRLCEHCMRLEPFAWIRRSTAARHFRFGKTLHEDPERPLVCVPLVGKAFGRKRDGPLYRFADIIRLAKDQFGEDFAERRANVVRNMFGIRKMQGQHFKDI